MNHVRTVIRSCGLCLTKVFIDDLCARGHVRLRVRVCICVCTWEAGGGGGQGRIWNPGEAGEQAGGLGGGREG